MSIVLKSNSVLVGSGLFDSVAAYKNRVVADGGVIINEGAVLDTFMFLKNNGITSSNMVAFVSLSFGIKLSNGNVTKLYSLTGANSDFTATRGTYPYIEISGTPSFLSTGDNTNILKTLEAMPYSPNLSMITSVTLNEMPSNYDHPIAEVWSTAGVSMPTGKVLGTMYHHVKDEAVFLGYGYGMWLTKQGKLTGAKHVISSRYSDNDTSSEGFIDNQSVGVDNRTDKYAVKNIDLFLAAQGTASPGGAKGNYHSHFVGKDLTREQHLAVADYLLVK